MNTFAVVTDSASDIPPALAEKFGIYLAPLHVVFQGRDYADGVDLDTVDLLDLMRGAEELPQTSQPTPADLLTVYRRVIEAGYREILSIHLTGELSSTIETARAVAAHMSDKARIEVVDSRGAAAMMGLEVLTAAAMAQDGATMDEAMEHIAKVRDATRIHFIPASLDNLVKGGRASKAQGFAASLLDIKVVAGLTPEGAICVERKSKGLRGAIKYVAQAVSQQAEEMGELMYYRLHTRASEAAVELESAVLKTGAACRFATEGTIGPTIAVHVGEGAIGIMCYPASLHNPALDCVSEYLTPRF